METGFTLERSEDGLSFTEIASLHANTTALSDGGLLVGCCWPKEFSFTDQNLQPGTSYNCRVRAFNGADSSAYSNKAGARTTEVAAQKSLRQGSFTGPE